MISFGNNTNNPPTTTSPASKPSSNPAGINIGAVDPPPINKSSVRKLLNDTKDAFQRQKNEAAALSEESNKQSQWTKWKNILIAGTIAAATIAGGTLAIVKGRSFPVLGEINKFSGKVFNKTPKVVVPEKLVTRYVDLLDYQARLGTKIGAEIPLERTDFERIKIDTESIPTDVNSKRVILDAINRTAGFFSHCDELTPHIKICMRDVSNKEKQQIIRCIKECRLDDIEDELIHEIIAVELNKAGADSSRDVLCSIEKQHFIDMDDSENVTRRMWKKFTKGVKDMVVGTEN